MLDPAQLAVLRLDNNNQVFHSNNLSANPHHPLASVVLRWNNRPNRTSGQVELHPLSHRLQQLSLLLHHPSRSLKVQLAPKLNARPAQLLLNARPTGARNSLLDSPLDSLAASLPSTSRAVCLVIF